MRIKHLNLIAFFAVSAFVVPAFSAVVSTEYVQEQLATKQPTGDYATNTALTEGLAGKQAVGDYATKTELSDGLATKQPTGDYATNTALTQGLATKAEGADLDSHVASVENPHSVTKAQLGLANVQNVDQTNASNLTSGTVAYDRLPVGTATSTVASGDDVRFNTIPTTKPSGTPPSGQVFIWFN